MLHIITGPLVPIRLLLLPTAKILRYGLKKLEYYRKMTVAWSELPLFIQIAFHSIGCHGKISAILGNFATMAWCGRRNEGFEQIFINILIGFYDHSVSRGVDVPEKEFDKST